MKKPKEIQAVVPGTRGRFIVTNHGHVLHYARTPKGAVELVTLPIQCELETGRLGWQLTKDRFFARDDLMRVFKGMPTAVDTSRDREVAAQREVNAARVRRIENAPKTKHGVKACAIKRVGGLSEETLRDVASLASDSAPMTKVAFVEFVHCFTGCSEDKARAYVNEALSQGLIAIRRLAGLPPAMNNASFITRT